MLAAVQGQQLPPQPNSTWLLYGHGEAESTDELSRYFVLSLVQWDSELEPSLWGSEGTRAHASATIPSQAPTTP